MAATMTHRNVKEYPALDKVRLVSRLADITNELISLIEDWYRMQADEVRAKAQAWISSMETTVTGRSKDVELAVYNTTASILEVRSQIEALKEERGFLLLVLGLEHGNKNG